MRFDENIPERKNLIFRVRKSEIAEIKVYLGNLKDKFKDIHLDSLRVGQLGEDSMLSFNVNAKYYDLIVHGLKSFGAESIIIEKNSFDEGSKTFKVIRSANTNINDLSNYKSKPKVSPEDSLENAIKSGNFEKVLQYSRDIKSGYSVTKKAKEGIEEAVLIAINENVNNATSNKANIEQCITALLSICANKSLRSLSKMNLMIEAGMQAIKICENSKDSAGTLIKIVNNNMIPNIIVVKAAERFADIALNNQEQFADELAYAAKNLNIRWLMISLDIVDNKLSAEEKNNLKNLMSYIEALRK